MRRLPVFALFVVSVLLTITYIGCRTTQTTSPLRDDPTAATAGQTFPAGSACATACGDLSTEASYAVCYSCRCKAAMDGYLPTAAEISCAAGAELKVYRLEGTGDAATVRQVTGPVDDCLNPDRLREGCHPGSRMVQIKKGDVIFKSICKRERFVENYNDLSIPFEESGFIGHNSRTGATCFWNDMGESNPGLISGTNQPDIDLTDGNADKVRKYLEKYYNVKDDHCTSCHDNDPFMYDPHLTTSGWITDSAYTSGPYNVVKIDGTLGRVPHRQLVSDDAEACTSCHRISDGNTCNYWALDSMGYSRVPTLQKEMHVDGGLWKVHNDAATGIRWTLPYWMPKGGSSPATQEAWTKKYGKALATIKKCCADPNAEGCQWAPIPATAEEAAQ